jgi:hypothetical protein
VSRRRMVLVGGGLVEKKMRVQETASDENARIKTPVLSYNTRCSLSDG